MCNRVPFVRPSHVFRVRNCFQMLRLYTGSVITKVIDFESWGNKTVRLLVRKSVSSYATTSVPELPVTHWTNLALPDQAITNRLHGCHKP